MGRNRTSAVFLLNGKPHFVGADHARMMLADYLRYELRLTGTKIVCAEGDCGACTVLRRLPLSGEKRYRPINSCITLVAQMDGSSIVTVDGLGNSENLTPVQKSMVETNASQCGFCTPGFVMAITGLVEKKLSLKDSKAISLDEAKKALTGNLCRCTGYQPILEAACSVPLEKCESIQRKFESKQNLEVLKKATAQPLLLENERFSFWAPKTSAAATQFLRKNPDAKIIGASTDLGVVHNKGKSLVEKGLSFHLIPELYKIQKKGKRIYLGSRVSISALRLFLKKEPRTKELANFIDLFASPQIKNNATVVGNIANASPIADLPPALLVCKARVFAVGPSGTRQITLDEFFLSYRRTALKKHEWIKGIDFEIPEKNEILSIVKASQRKDLDISAVSAAYRVSWSNGKGKEIKDCLIAMGGVAEKPIRLKRTENLLKSSVGNLGRKEILKVIESLQKEITPISDLRGSAAFRRILAENFLMKFIEERLSK